MLLWRANRTAWMNWGMDGTGEVTIYGLLYCNYSTCFQAQRHIQAEHGAKPVSALRDAGSHPSGRGRRI